MFKESKEVLERAITAAKDVSVEDLQDMREILIELRSHISRLRPPATKRSNAANGGVWFVGLVDNRRVRPGSSGGRARG